MDGDITASFRRIRHLSPSKQTTVARSRTNPGLTFAPSPGKLVVSYDFPIKWLAPFYPANPSQAADSGEKWMDLRFLRLRRRLLKQQPNKTLGQHRTIRQEVSDRIFAPIRVPKMEEYCMYPQGVCRIRKPACAGNGCAIFPIFGTAEVGQKDG